MSQQLNIAIAQLQENITSLDEAGKATRKELVATIETTHAAVVETIKLTKHSKALELFFENIAQAIGELYQVAQSPVDNPQMARSKAILQHLADQYQQNIVPMLTRLHNLAEDSDEMHKITNLAYLGNEIMSCANQIYQFSEKMDLSEKIYGMLGMLLMMAAIGLTITVLSANPAIVPMILPLRLVTLGCILCRISIKQHDNDPEVDLARKAVTNTEKAIQSAKELLVDPKTILEHEVPSAIIIEKAPEKIKATAAISPKKVNIEKQHNPAPANKKAEPEQEAVQQSAENKPAGLTAKFKSAFSFIKNLNKE